MTLILPKNKITAETNLKFMAILSPKLNFFSLTYHSRIASKSYKSRITSKSFRGKI